MSRSMELMWSLEEQGLSQGLLFPSTVKSQSMQQIHLIDFLSQPPFHNNGQHLLQSEN